MTDRRSATTAEKSAKRQGRRVARKKLGLKEGDPREADHVKPKKGKKSYNNAKSNLRAVSKSAHKKKAKGQGLTGGRPKKK